MNNARRFVFGSAICFCLYLMAGCASNGYIGRTTLMESFSGKPAASLSISARLAKLISTAKSKTVFASAAKNLGNQGINVSADDLSRCVTVRPVKNTNIFAIEAFSTDPNSAKTIADTVARQAKIECRKKLGAELKTIDPPYISPAKRRL